MAISKVTYAGNTLIDLTGDTVAPENLLSGTTAHAANGEEITGIVEDKKGELEAQIADLRNRVEVNENAIETLSTIKSIAIPSSAWSGSVPYTNTVTVSGVKASDNWEIVGFTPTGDTNSDKAIKEALGFIAYGTTANNSITFRCLESKPTVNLPIVIRKVGI